MSARFPDPAAVTPDYVVSVKELCAFTAKAGDLDLRFTPSPTAQEGVAGHKIVAARRPSTQLAEVVVKGTFEGVAVRGRADGYDPSKTRLEEVKTCRGGPDRVPDNHRSLHWAQAETYAHLICREDKLPEMTVALVYFDIGTREESALERQLDAVQLQALFEDRCQRFGLWAASEIAHRAARDGALSALAFPHSEFRAGQRELAEATYRGAREGRCVLAQAPTGIGKTVGTLFPALKALASRQLDKVFFLTAKTSGRQLALEGLKTIAAGRPLPLRVIELVAREQACEHPDKACHGEACPLARGFYDRLPAARQAAIDSPFLDRERVRSIALAHDVCPYYLGQELVKWSDVVVGDYNHFFDPSAMLHGMTRANDWRVVVLVDEAHNLVERGRAMYSTALSLRALRAVARLAQPGVKRALKAVDRCWKELVGGQASDYLVHDELPSRFTDRLDAAVAAISACQAEHPHGIDPPTLQLFFDLNRFARLAESFGAHSLFDSTRLAPGAAGRADSILCVRNVVPAPHFAPRFAAAQSVTLFSATLSPTDFYREMLGLPAQTVVLDVESPFSAEQLRVRTARHISTRFGDRATSVAPIAALIAEQFDAAPGNYIAFFSSFDYLEQVANELLRARPNLAVWRQAARMSEAEQQAFLAHFRADGEGVGFAVLGGRFAEGIDLPGRRLVGAFVATLGLPQVNPVNEHMRRLMDRQFGMGYEYTYLYPGLRKVVQAAGRVIRSASDRGTVHLIDDRYTHSRVRALLPRWWRAPAAGGRS
jgi:DNA excision repair protein ERCC-2